MKNTPNPSGVKPKVIYRKGAKNAKFFSRI